MYLRLVSVECDFHRHLFLAVNEVFTDNSLTRNGFHSHKFLFVFYDDFIKMAFHSNQIYHQLNIVISPVFILVFDNDLFSICLPFLGFGQVTCQLPLGQQS